MPDTMLKTSDIGNLVSRLSNLNRPSPIQEWVPIKVWSFSCTDTENNIDYNRDILVEYFGNPKVYGKDKLPEDMKKAMAVLKHYAAFASRGQEVFGKKIKNNIMELAVICPDDVISEPPMMTVIYFIARIQDFDKYK